MDFVHLLRRFQPPIFNLNALLRFYRDDGLRFTLMVAPGQMTPALFQALFEAGLWSEGSGTVPALVPAALLGDLATAPGEIYVRCSGPEEKDLYLDLFQQAFADCEEGAAEYRAFQWAEDALPGGVRYVAEIGGKPVGMASFPIVGGVGFFGTAGVVPECRKRSVRMALIQKRIADAADLGCDLILGGSSPGRTEFRKFERADPHLIPTGTVWKELGAAEK